MKKIKIAAGLLALSMLTGCGRAAGYEAIKSPVKAPEATAFIRYYGEGSGEDTAAEINESPSEPDESSGPAYKMVGSFVFPHDSLDKIKAIPQQEQCSFLLQYEYIIHDTAEELIEKLSAERDEAMAESLENEAELLRSGADEASQDSFLHALKAVEFFAEKGCSTSIRKCASEGGGKKSPFYICTLNVSPEKLFELAGECRERYSVEPLSEFKAQRYAETLWESGDEG